MELNLKGKPFYLEEDQVAWVNETYESMSLEEKAGQLICGGVPVISDELIDEVTKEHKLGGMLLRPFPVAGLKERVSKLQSASKIPMFITGNLEYGGCGVLNEGTYFAQPMACAAARDKEAAYRLGKISFQEAAAIGVNWGFAPVVDLDLDYHNPIVNVRSFGKDPDVVIEMAREYIKAAQECGVVPTIKHFPGDGSDERDQHLLVSVNSLDEKAWMESYGKIYQTLIDDGALTVMVGHIAQPQMARAMVPGISDEEAYLPATQSKALMTNLLREKMGFNGLVVTDSTLMNGFMVKMPRRKSIPLTIENGSDMILFNRSMSEDIRYLKEGVENGILSEERLEAAVKRVLALKAAMGLPKKQKEGNLVPDTDIEALLSDSRHKQWVDDIADRAVTLVKDTKNLIPLSPERTKRVYLNVIEGEVNDNSSFAQDMKKRLEQEGFEVTLRIRAMDIDPAEMFSKEPSPEFLRVMGEINSDTETFVKQYDLCILVLNIETISNATVVRINWKVLAGLGNDFPWYCGEIPLVTVSFANPYHLLDAPMSHVYVNAYSNNPETRAAVIEKLLGKSEFKGESPIDPFCGHEDCRL